MSSKAVENEDKVSVGNELASSAVAKKNSLLDEVLASSAQALPLPSVVVGTCINTEHPSLKGRVQVCWRENIHSESTTKEQWISVLQGLAVRVNDRVLLTHASNYAEPIVTGVIDGFARRPEIQKQAAASLKLQPDEALVVHSSQGQPLLELSASEDGPVLKLLNDNVSIDFPGECRIRAQSLKLQATQGNVNIEADDDVCIQGETINLN